MIVFSGDDKSLFQCLFVINFHLLIKKKVLLVMEDDLTYYVPISFNQMCRRFHSWFLYIKKRKKKKRRKDNTRFAERSKLSYQIKPYIQGRHDSTLSFKS